MCTRRAKAQTSAAYLQCDAYAMSGLLAGHPLRDKAVNLLGCPPIVAGATYTGISACESAGTASHHPPTFCACLHSSMQTPSRTMHAQAAGCQWAALPRKRAHLAAAAPCAAPAAPAPGRPRAAQALAEAIVPACQIHQRLGHLLIGSRQAVDQRPCIRQSSLTCSVTDQRQM